MGTSKALVIHSEGLKLIAILFMMIDHIGFLFYPDYPIFRIIGRVAFPLFVYQIVIGFDFTRNKKKMLYRLLFFMMVSLIPYWWMSDTWTINIFGTLSIGFCAIWMIQKKKYWITFLLICIPLFIPIDYEWYGVLIIILVYCLRAHFVLMIMSLSLITFIYSKQIDAMIQMYAIIGFLIAPLLTKIDIHFKMHKYFHYAFYPVHIIILTLLANMW